MLHRKVAMRCHRALFVLLVIAACTADAKKSVPTKDASDVPPFPDAPNPSIDNPTFVVDPFDPNIDPKPLDPNEPTLIVDPIDFNEPKDPSDPETPVIITDPVPDGEVKPIMIETPVVLLPDEGLKDGVVSENSCWKTVNQGPPYLRCEPTICNGASSEQTT